MKHIYHDGTYIDENPSWHEEDSAWKAEKISSIIKKNVLIPSTVCEIGCGAGEILNELSETYKQTEFHGYEISPQAHKLSTSKTKPNLTFKLANLFESGHPHFDLMLAIDVFEHVEDYLGFLES